MTSQNLIGKTIVELFEKIQFEEYGIDQGELFLKLDSGELISFPFDLGFKSFLVDDNQVADAKNILQEASESNESWMIKDLIEVSDPLSNPYIELQCGILFTEESMGQNGTGMAGLRLYQNLEAFESMHGKKYVRLSEQ